MLTLEGLVIRQDDFELRADFAVPEGALVAVLGPSGAGNRAPPTSAATEPATT